MKKVFLSITLMAAIALAGCWYQTGGALVGAGAGAGVGAIIANNTGYQAWHGAAIGAAVGAVVGLIAGDIIDKHQKRNFEHDRDVIMRYNQEYLDRMAKRYE